MSSTSINHIEPLGSKAARCKHNINIQPFAYLQAVMEQQCHSFEIVFHLLSLFLVSTNSQGKYLTLQLLRLHYVHQLAANCLSAVWF